MSVNKVFLVGRLGQKPEFKQLQSGSSVCNFSIVTSESWTDKSGQKQERTEWHKIVAWGKLAEICGHHLDKGKEVFIEGRLQTREWENKDKKIQHTTEINASNVQFLDSAQDVPKPKKAVESTRKSWSPPQTEEPEKHWNEDDIPF